MSILWEYVTILITLNTTVMQAFHEMLALQLCLM
jgi:hypothetical protein